VTSQCIGRYPCDQWVHPNGLQRFTLLPVTRLMVGRRWLMESAWRGRRELLYLIVAVVFPEE